MMVVSIRLLEKPNIQIETQKFLCSLFTASIDENAITTQTRQIGDGYSLQQNENSNLSVKLIQVFPV